MLYLQLYQDIKDQILTGQLLSGEKLPSKRQLASNRGVSLNTVTAALDQLIAEGYLEAKERSGYYVLDQVLASSQPIKRAYKEVIQPAPEIDWRYGGVDHDFPINSWKRTHNQVLNQDPSLIYRTGEPMGERVLREAISKHLWTAKGIHAPSSHILIGSSSQELLGKICQLLGPLRLGVEDPGNHQWIQTLKPLIKQTLPIPLDQYGANPSADQLKQIDLLYVTPSYQFPTGTIMSIGRKQSLIDWATRENKWVIEDAYNSDFRYEGKPIPPLKAIDTHDRVIYLQSFSSLISPSIHLTFMVLPDELMYRIQKNHQTSCQVPLSIQATVAEWIQTGHYARHLNRMRRKYSKKRQVLENWIARKEYLASQGTNAGLHFILHYLGKDFTSQELVQLAADWSVGLSPLSDYELNFHSHHPSFVIGYGRSSLQAIDIGIQHLEEAWDM